METPPSFVYKTAQHNHNLWKHSQQSLNIIKTSLSNVLKASIRIKALSLGLDLTRDLDDKPIMKFIFIDRRNSQETFEMQCDAKLPHLYINTVIIHCI